LKLPRNREAAVTRHRAPSAPLTWQLRAAELER
jgi:hypothetical protein